MKKKFAYGGKIEPKNKGKIIIAERGWYKCIRCGRIFENYSIISLFDHICKGNEMK